MVVGSGTAFGFGLKIVPSGITTHAIFPWFLENSLSIGLGPFKDEKTKNPHALQFPFDQKHVMPWPMMERVPLTAS
ncbi:MAG: hypothetical protein FWF31_09920 [Desulfobulbus sp.]|nr:hypothetical protein [Desulfobulbus sp.]